MKTELSKIRSELEDALLYDDTFTSSAGKLNEATALIREALFKIKSNISEDGFESQNDEIEFFKLFKPAILALKIGLIYRYNLKLNEPVGTSETILKYYESEIKSIQSFFRINSFHYQYYKNNLTNMDTDYFLRNAGPLDLPTEDINDLDPNFSTPMSLLFAKFKGYESIQQFSLNQIALACAEPTKKTPGDSLKWTGDSINVVELAYGLYLTGQLNNGNASLNQIVRWLEENLQVKIGVVQRRFTEIGRRKRLSQTKYIDQMKENIQEKIDQGNS
ncbi:RteC domain-containing protein [Mucilaginibacter rigui]|uniref:RteC domain-containing protein n=1 Tax=Mucilaginibacter rigui TaxID=534635 RepID=A0ABR7X5L3_9SPHI|nr:RteC domain-containing protein [Mucilaginibacter rigui]MBD1385878.1 RteC domain-containing protein [Mucilaginibacter rigui]